MFTVYSRILTKCLLNRLWMCHYVIKRFVTQQKISSRNGIFFRISAVCSNEDRETAGKYSAFG